MHMAGDDRLWHDGNERSVSERVVTRSAARFHGRPHPTHIEVKIVDAEGRMWRRGVAEVLTRGSASCGAIGMIRSDVSFD